MTIFSRAARSRRGIAGILVGLAVLGLAMSGAFSGQAAQAPGALVAGQPVPSAAVHRLATIAASFVKQEGGQQPDWVTAVMTTHARALDSATPGDSEHQDAKVVVYLVTIKGDFIGYGASVPAGSPLPTGRYLSIVVNARTYSIMDWGLSPKAPAVSPARLGPVTRLPG